MQAYPLQGENGKYIYFPEEKDTVLNADSFSISYLGINAESKTKVICKHINSDSFRVNSGKLNIYIEASRILKHANIVNTIDIIIEKDFIMLIQEYSEHYTLRDLIYNKSLKGDKYYDFFIKIIINSLIGLEFLHSNGLCHCNLNPGNIQILHYYNGKPNFEDPLVKITGLELMKLNNSHSPSNWDNLKSADILYSSPEIVLNIQNLVSPSSDIYSMGLILYESISKHHLMSEYTNQFFIKRMQYSTPVRNFHNLEDYMFSIVKKACNKVEFMKSSRYYSEEEIAQILSLGISNRFISAKELGIILIKYLDYLKSSE